jgi:hypothetical protein
VIRSSETSIHIWITRRYIPADDSFHDYRFENLKSYNMGTVDSVFYVAPGEAV